MHPPRDPRDEAIDPRTGRQIPGISSLQVPSLQQGGPYEPPVNPRTFWDRALDTLVRKLSPLDVTSGRSKGLAGGEQIITPPTVASGGEIAVELARVTAPEDKAEVLTVHFDLALSGTQPADGGIPAANRRAIAEARVRYGSGNHQTTARLDVVRGTTISVIASTLYVEGIVRAATTTEPSGIIRMAAIVGRGLRESTTPAISSNRSLALAGGGGEIEFTPPDKSVGVRVIRTDPDIRSMRVDLRNPGGAIGMEAYALGQNMTDWLWMSRGTSVIRVVNTTVGAGNTMDVLIEFLLSL